MDSLHARVFDVEAYVAQIYIHFPLLTHAAGLVLQVSDGNMPPACAIARSDFRFHLHYEYVLGPCAYADFRSGGGFNIIVFKPYPNRHCCRLVGSIAHTQEKHGLLLFNFLELETLRPIRKDQWQLSGGENLIVELDVVCQFKCVGISFHIYNLQNSTSATTLVYRASLTEKEELRLHESFDEAGYWKQMCLDQSCYIWPVRPNRTTWNDANEECERNNASLLSIHSEAEMALVSRLSQNRPAYIGLKVKVSRKN